MSASFKIAWRFLISSRGQTILIALGIGIGIAVQIFIGSLIQGLQAGLVETTIGNSSQITIKNEEDGALIQDFEFFKQFLEANNFGLSAISPVLDQPGLILNDEQSNSILMRGLDFDAAEDIYKLDSKIMDGQLPKENSQVVIGVALQKKLNVKVGDTIEVNVLNGIKSDFLLVGILDFKVQILNETWFLTPLSSVQHLFDQKDKISAIEMQVPYADVFKSDVKAEKIETEMLDWIQQESQETGEDTLVKIKITNWKEQNQQLLSGLNGQSVSSYMIQIFVVISVVLGIASVLAISVLQKSKQIGILKAMGIKNAAARKIFLYQGLLLGALGGIIGLLLGLGLSYSFTLFALNPDGTPVVKLLIQPAFLVFSFALAVIASSLASLLPASKSAKLDPIEVIRNG